MVRCYKRGFQPGILIEFGRTSMQFSKMYERKAFLSTNTSKGIDEMEFMEAQTNLTELIAEYLQGEIMIYDEDDGSDHDDED